MTLSSANDDPAQRVVSTTSISAPGGNGGVKRKGATLERKRVTFAAILEAVYVLPPSYYHESEVEVEGEEEAAMVEQAALENENRRRTSELTVLSSVHGRARRDLRDICVFDLQSAIQYGVMSRAHDCQKTGMPRWKYVYGNIVYITDYTSTKEVTSYKQAISIQPASITQEMLARHARDCQILKDDPSLCATHSIIIIDQSGSMRNSDVKGFRNRSEAAYGVLALEYIAEQLHQRGGHDGILDAVSVIEMNDIGTVLCDREPLDWILFNKLLKRQKSAKPRSHGNYNDSLYVAEKLIHKVYQDTKDADPEQEQDIMPASTIDYADPEDMPSSALILLSDGKPSDKRDDDVSTRNLILEGLSLSLTSNFSFHAIGLGASDADFAALQGMATTVKASGCDGTFYYSELNSAHLSAAFTSVSTSMTATRTEKLSTTPRETKAVQLRSKYVPSDKRQFRRHTEKVSRWRYDQAKYDSGDNYPWTSVSFKNDSACAFDMEVDPFGKGAERLAFLFHELDGNNKRVGNSMVAKETIRANDEERKIKFHETFCRAQKRASELAERFNKVVKKTPSLRPTENSLKTPDIAFLKCFVYEYRAIDGTTCGLLVEEFLKGKFTKYNSNSGYVKSNKGERTIDLEIGNVFITDFLQAFSHWVYFSTDQKLLVCDLQGVLNEEGWHPRFQLTDPCICSRQGRGRKRYGRSDMRMKGIRMFRKNHKCNNVCKGLGLPPFGMRRK
jgi:hypothetical protein